VLNGEKVGLALHARDFISQGRWASFEWAVAVSKALDELDLAGIHWLITGGESGASNRACSVDWVRPLRDRCQAQGVAFFHKQWGGRTPKPAGRLLDGRTWDEMPVVLDQDRALPELWDGGDNEARD